jgi:beta-lactamase regulating signal transducer with metallopeptidase domain
MKKDAPWQAPFAAIAATLPGAVFLVLAVVDLAGAPTSGCLQFLWGRVFFAVILILTILALARAVVLACRRAAEVRRLIAVSHSPSGLVSEIAHRVGVAVRVLSYHEPFCALAGVAHPVVLISSATLERLDTEELEAALLHERAHALRGDVALAATVSFFADLLPLPSTDLVQTYNVAREFAADEHAIRTAAPEHLAAAILSLAGSREIAHSMPALAEDSGTMKARVLSLLEERAAQTGLHGRRIIVASALTAIVLLSFAPAVVSAHNYYTCTIKGMHP